MISIIICSRSLELFDKVEIDIKNTIGIPCEVIRVDNSQNKFGICEAYNQGAANSKYDILCFAHEDLSFKTEDWGEIVLDIFKDQTIGVLGVAGGTYQVDAPSGWGGGGLACVRMNVMHTTKDRGTTVDYINPTTSKLVDVAAVDGLWICARKSVWSKYPFDAKAFPAFHFYDIDFCTRIFPHHRICVTLNVLIEHFSHGSFDDIWYKSALDFYKKRYSYLPFGVAELSAEEKKEIRLKTLFNFTKEFVYRRINKHDSLYLIYEYLKQDIFNRDAWWLLKKIISDKY